jgi:hypothetical protein
MLGVICVTLNGGYYVATRALSSPWYAQSGRVSPVFLTREDAESWARRNNWIV